MRPVSVLVILVLLLSASASAQEQPPERVLIDVVLRSVPADLDGHCIQLEPGVVRAALSLVPEQPLEHPVHFTLAGSRGADPASFLVLALGSQPVTWDVSVRGGLYCYAVENRAQVSPGATIDERLNLA